MILDLGDKGKIVEHGIERTVGPAQLSLYNPFPMPDDLVVAMVETTNHVTIAWNNGNDPPLELEGEFYLIDWRSQHGETTANYMSQKRCFMKVPFSVTS